MKKIKLLNLKLKNFMGVKEKSYDFGNVTMISGGNEAGKTTIADAYSWLLFGKDSHDKTTFDLKRKVNGVIQHNLEYSVAGTFEINGEPITIKRVLKEVWSGTTGKDKVLTGHTTKFTWGEKKALKKEFDALVEKTFVVKDIKILAEPLYFLEQVHWTKQRELLFKLCDSNEEVEGYESIKAKLSEDVSLDDLTTRFKANEKELKVLLKEVPVKIDTLTNQIVEIDTKTINMELEKHNTELQQIDTKLQDNSKLSDKKLKLQQEIFDSKSKMQSIQNAIKTSLTKNIVDYAPEIEKAEKNIKNLEKEIENYNKQISTDQSKADLIEKEELPKLREETRAKMQEQFTEVVDTKCPTCGQELPAERVEEVKAKAVENFNVQKNKEVAEMTSIGKSKKSNLEFIKSNLEQLKIRLMTLQDELKSLQSNLKILKKKKSAPTEDINLEVEYDKNVEIKGLKAHMFALEKNIAEFKPSMEIEELKLQKAQLRGNIDKSKELLGQEKFNEKLQKDIEKLEAEQKNIQAQLLDAEAMVSEISDYKRKKIKLVEAKINALFAKDVLQFKFFEENLSNDVINEVCVPMVKGVNFPSVNYGARINAGIEMINVLSNKFNISIPIWIDNRESISDILDTNAQVINLKVIDHAAFKIETLEA